MFVYGEDQPRQRPFQEPCEAIGWNMQCSMTNQWDRSPVNNNFGDINPSVQCYNRNYYDNVQYYPTQEYPVSYVPEQRIINNLPCQQVQQWDYSNMCYNVDGQPCQYTSVVDLEDFM